VASFILPFFIRRVAEDISGEEGAAEDICNAPTVRIRRLLLGCSCVKCGFVRGDGRNEATVPLERRREKDWVCREKTASTEATRTKSRAVFGIAVIVHVLQGQVLQ